MIIDHEQLADVHTGNYDERIRRVDRIDSGELEQYRLDINAWLSVGHPGTHFNRDADDLIRRPHDMTTSIPAFFRWMRDNHRGPWAEQTFRPGDLIEYHTIGHPDEWHGPFRVVGGRDDGTVWFDENGRDVHVQRDRVRLALNPPPPRDEVVTVAGGFHVGDTVRYNQQGVRPGHVSGVIRGNYADGAIEYDNGLWDWVRVLELEHCPHRPDPDPAHPADEQPAPEVGTTSYGENYIPWGPRHPDWDEFWAKADAAARRAGYCDEYNRLADELGRTSPDEVVTYEITLRVNAKVPRGTQLIIGQAYGIATHQYEDIRRAQDHIEHLGDQTVQWHEVDRRPYHD